LERKSFLVVVAERVELGVGSEKAGGGTKIVFSNCVFVNHPQSSFNFPSEDVETSLSKKLET
jgi:hypothetical protein